MTSAIKRHTKGFVVAAAVIAIVSLAYGDVPIELTDGVPVSGLSGDAGSEVDYRIAVPAGQGELEISISGGTGDCDLYVRYGGAPDYTLYDYRPFLYGNEETVTIANPAAGGWYIMLRGRHAYSDVTLVASYTPAVATELENGVPKTGISGSHDSDRLFSIDVPAGEGSLEVNTWDGAGNLEVLVKHGSPPSEFDYDASSSGYGTEQGVSISDPAAGTWYIVLHTSYHYNDVTLRAVYGSPSTEPAESGMEDVVIEDLSGDAGSEAVYVIDVTSRQGGLDFSISGGTGNCDMYIKKGVRPTTSDYDFRPTSPGNTESIFITTGNMRGPWYVLLVGAEAYEGVTLTVHYIPPDLPPEPEPKPDVKVTPLIAGVPVSDLAGKAGSELYFSIDVPSGINTLNIKMSGGTGDADLYVRKSRLPTTSEYDYRPYVTGNNEQVTITKWVPGTWYIMIRSYEGFSDVTLVATFGGISPDGGVIALGNGVPVTGLDGHTGSQQFFKIEVPPNQTRLEIAMSGGTGDADLYVRLGDKPTTKEWDYRPFRLGNKEMVTIDDPKAGTYFIMIRGYLPYAGVTLQATYGPGGEQIKVLESGVPVTDLSGAQDSEIFFKINVPAGQSLLHIGISGGTGDADLYVKKGEKPTAKSWDYCPFLHGNNEEVEIQDPAAAAWYIMIRGYQAYSGLTLKACYQVGKGDCDDEWVIIVK